MGIVVRGALAPSGDSVHEERRPGRPAAEVLTPNMFRVVEWTAIALFAATLLMFILVVLMRVRLEMRERRREKFLAVWEPILMRSVDVASSDVPHLRRGDLMNFLLLWNHLHESLLDEAKDHLNQIARALCIGDAALRML